MNARKISGFPLVVLLIFAAFLLSVSIASAQEDGKRTKPPVIEGGWSPGDHSGGDPDNPVPVVDPPSGGGHLRVDVRPEWGYYLGDNEALSRENIFQIMNAVFSSVGTVFLL